LAKLLFDISAMLFIRKANNEEMMAKRYYVWRHLYGVWRSGDTIGGVTAMENREESMKTQHGSNDSAVFVMAKAESEKKTGVCQLSVVAGVMATRK
jgi:hypothetical protein